VRGRCFAQQARTSEPCTAAKVKRVTVCLRSSAGSELNFAVEAAKKVEADGKKVRNRRR